MLPRILALVPARGGSKGLPGKNMAEIGGHPMVAHSILAGLDCPYVARTVVTTDDAAIAQAARRYGADVIDRPAALACDTARSEDAVFHALAILEERGYAFDLLVLLQPTSPLRDVADVSAAVELFQSAPDARSLMSVTEEEHSPFKALLVEDGRLQPLFERHHLSAPRQTLPRVYRQNGAIYIVRVDAFRAESRFYLEPTLPFIMPTWKSVDVDTRSDLDRAREAMANPDRAAQKPQFRTGLRPCETLT